MDTSLTLTDYPALHQAILDILATGKERARQAIEQEKVRTYWEVGQTLHTHFLAHKDRAEYGEQVMTRLAQDLGMGERLLYDILLFYRAFPILHARAKLSWTHYRQLSAITEKQRRRAYEKAAEEKAWSVRELTTAIKTHALEQSQDESFHTQPAQPPSLLKPRYGSLYTYRLVQSTPEHPIKIDLGFGLYYEFDRDDLEEAGGTMMVVSNHVGGPSYRLQSATHDTTRLYTYRADLREVIDGDTLWVDVDCGFGIWRREKLRLRNIDTPEMSTKAGIRARDFVVEALAKCRYIVLSTSKTDKYDRYVADVFYRSDMVNAEKILEDGVYLNQQLIDEGLARVMDY